MSKEPTAGYDPATDSLLQERGTTHGSFLDNAVIAQETKHIWHNSPNWEKMNAIQREALDLIAIKISRVLSGDANHLDHWSDVAGYATLATKDGQK